jgi:hypothetical protein
MRGCAAWLGSPIIETTIATTIPSSVPKTSTPANAASAQRNSIFRTCRIAANSAGWTSPTEWTITTAASTALGSSQSSGARKSMVASAIAAGTSEAFCDRPPTARTTEVCEVPAGIAPTRAPPRLAALVASSSRPAEPCAALVWAIERSPPTRRNRETTPLPDVPAREGARSSSAVATLASPGAPPRMPAP